MTKTLSRNRPTEASFSLAETLIAVFLLIIFVSQITSVFGNAVYFSDYGRQSGQAMSIAKAIMSKVEYLSQAKDFKEMLADEKSQVVEGFPEYTYDLSIKEWKLPIEQLLGAKSSGGDEEDSSESADKNADPMMQGVAQVLGDDLFRVAYTEVSWAEGAKKNSVSLVLLLTNQKKLDELGMQNKATYDSVYRQALNPQNTSGAPVPNTIPQPGVSGAAGRTTPAPIVTPSPAGGSVIP